MNVKPTFDLTGRVALVTGASRGLGRGIALILAAAGADVVIVARSAEALERVAAEIRELGREALAIPADLTDCREGIRAVEETVRHFGRLDILVNNAGTNLRKPAFEVTEADWDYMVSLNLKTAFFTAQAAGRHMVAAFQQDPSYRRKIINIGSVATSLALPNASVYGVTKGGIGQLTKCLALEWAKLGVNVNAIAPGYFYTDLTEPLLTHPEHSARILGRTPLGRTGEIADLAGAVVFLASPASDYITGQVIYVDGGWTAW
jgi:2-deoxy-D-gluconate 3-dehydrogenase